MAENSSSPSCSPPEAQKMRRSSAAEMCPSSSGRKSSKAMSTSRVRSSAVFASCSSLRCTQNSHKSTVPSRLMSSFSSIASTSPGTVSGLTSRTSSRVSCMSTSPEPSVSKYANVSTVRGLRMRSTTPFRNCSSCSRSLRLWPTAGVCCVRIAASRLSTSSLLGAEGVPDSVLSRPLHHSRSRPAVVTSVSSASLRSSSIRCSVCCRLSSASALYLPARADTRSDAPPGLRGGGGGLCAAADSSSPSSATRARAWPYAHCPPAEPHASAGGSRCSARRCGALAGCGPTERRRGPTRARLMRSSSRSGSGASVSHSSSSVAPDAAAPGSSGPAATDIEAASAASADDAAPAAIDWPRAQPAAPAAPSSALSSESEEELRCRRRASARSAPPPAPGRPEPQG
mmetsp:Transcript_51694/g.168159  ORF Transcript_51694/g.168159 Transcript_51694/m.168159 type:complete len:400 (-) Transcript_51694:9-1208(-)